MNRNFGGMGGGGGEYRRCNYTVKLSVYPSVVAVSHQKTPAKLQRVTMVFVKIHLLWVVTHPVNL